MADPKSLSSFDFSAMLGGPLTAMIDAQTQATQASLDFIYAKGFKDSQPQLIPFDVSKSVTGADGTVEQRQVRYNIPVLTLLNIPFIRIAETSIEFHARIVSASQDDISTGMRSEDDAEPLPSRLKLRAKYSLRQRKPQGGDDHKNYSMSIKMKAVQEDMPPGLERLIGLLEHSIQEAPANDEAEPRRQ